MDKIMDINVGDDVTLSGVVRKIENGCVLVEFRESVWWFNPGEIKTIRPNKVGEI